MGSYLLVQVEPATGILLDHSGARATNAVRCYLCFGSEEEATEYAVHRLQREPLGEWHLLDERGEPLDAIRDPAAVAEEADRVALSTSRNKSWWRRVLESWAST